MLIYWYFKYILIISYEFHNFLMVWDINWKIKWKTTSVHIVHWCKKNLFNFSVDTSILYNYNKVAINVIHTSIIFFKTNQRCLFIINLIHFIYDPPLTTKILNMKLNENLKIARQIKEIIFKPWEQQEVTGYSMEESLILYTW